MSGITGKDLVNGALDEIHEKHKEGFRLDIKRALRRVESARITLVNQIENLEKLKKLTLEEYIDKAGRGDQ